MFITVGGALGSGKSTVCSFLKSKYGYEIFSTGALLRDLAADKGMTAFEFNHFITHSENEVDAYIDGRLREAARLKTGERVVFDSRLAWFFVPHAFKVFLVISDETAAERVFRGRREEVETYASKEEALSRLKGRKSLEDLRFKNLYGVDCNNPANYDLILSTEHISAEEAADAVINGAEKK